MPKATHRLEQRAALLATRLNERATAFRDALAPPGQRPPFSTALSQEAAMDWWGKHRLDDLGKQVLERWSPDQIAELDATLARRTQTRLEAGVPTVPEEVP